MSANVWDRKSALKRLKGNEKLLDKVLEKYRRAAPTVIVDLQSSIQQDNDKLIRYGAHTLSGMASSVGAVKVAKVAETLEAEFSTLNLSQREDLWNQIHSAQNEFEMLFQAGT